MVLTWKSCLLSVWVTCQGTYLKLSLFLSNTVADCLKLSQSSKIVGMCLNLSLILSHVPAPKAHTSQGTIHGYVHSWNNLAQPDPDPTGPLLPHHQARSSLPAHDNERMSLIEFEDTYVRMLDPQSIACLFFFEQRCRSWHAACFPLQLLQSGAESSIFFIPLSYCFIPLSYCFIPLSYCFRCNFCLNETLNRRD